MYCISYEPKAGMKVYFQYFDWATVFDTKENAHKYETKEEAEKVLRHLVEITRRNCKLEEC